MTGPEPFEFDRNSYAAVAGVDEAGRGPLAGDVVAAAVILDPAKPIEGLADSKKLSEKRRERLFDEINERALAVSIGRASPAEIDALNILHATMLAMHRAADGLSVQPSLVLVDGNRLPEWSFESIAVVKGDQRVQEISAASIIAKVARDRDLLKMEEEYPGYGFAGHKGYPTKAHMQALVERGATPYHRRSFRPVREAIERHESRDSW